MDILVSWVVLTLAVWITALVLPGVPLKNHGSALLVAAIFAVQHLHKRTPRRRGRAAFLTR